MELTKAEALIQNAQWQQKLETARLLASDVLKEAGDMGEGNSKEGWQLLSDAVRILEGYVCHFSLEQCDLEEGCE